VLAQTLPTDGTPVDAFRMPVGQLMMYVEEFVASDKPAKKTLPVAFDDKKPFALKRAAGNFRLTVDGET